MKRLNNKGFAISTLLYGSILIIFLIVVALMATLGTTRKNTKNLMYQIDDELNRYSNINQHFVYDQDIDDEAGRKIFILEDGWYLIELWDTTNKFSGVAYFKKDEKINVYLKAKDADEVSYITFGENPNEADIKHFSAVKYTAESKTNSEFKISKLSNDPENKVPIPEQETKLNNVQYIRDCMNSINNNSWVFWTEIQAYDNNNNKIDLSSKTWEFDNKGGTTGSGGIDAQKVIFDNKISKQESGTYFGVKNTDTSKSLCITINLGSKYNLSEIAVWHFHEDFRKYPNHKISVSETNEDGSFREVYSGSRKETLLGIRYADRYIIN